MNLKQIFLLSASLVLLSGCNTPTESSSSPIPTESPEETSQQSESTETGSEQLPDWVDYSGMAETHLQLDYEGRDFFVDGVGVVERVYPIDGDTAHFDMVNTTTSSERVKARFYGIDTPESTGAVQPWGVAASNYTKGILKEAEENGTIVVTADIYDEYRAPTHDSTGERYLCCIYVNTEKKNAPKEEMQLLNLMIVEQGYSWARNTSNIPEFSDYFQDAQTQASLYKLVVFSGEDDPNYNYGNYVQTSLLDMQLEQKKALAAELAGGITYDGTHSMPLVGTADGIKGILDDDLTSSSMKAGLYDPETGLKVEADAYTDLGGTSEEPSYYLIGFEDVINLTRYYATAETLESGDGLEVTANLEQAAKFSVYQNIGGFSISLDGQYLGYDIDGTDPFLAYDDKDWIWAMDSSDKSLSISLQFYYHNRKVTIQGTVVGSSNNIIYLQDVYEDEDTGERQYAGVNVFPGMGGISDRFTIPNTYIQVKGLASNSQFGFQITDCNFPRVNMGHDNESSVIYTAAENIDIHQLHPYEMTPEQLSQEAATNNLDHLGCFVRLTEPVTCTNVYIPEGENAEATIYFGDLEFSVYKTFLYKGDPDRPNYNWVEEADFVGKSFMIEGIYTYHKGQTSGRISFQINPSDASGIVWVQEA